MLFRSVARDDAGLADGGIGRVEDDAIERDAARFEEGKENYDQLVKNFVQKAFDDVPRIPLFQPSMDVAMQKDVMGYQYWFHRRLDYRALVKS